TDGTGRMYSGMPAAGAAYCQIASSTAIAATVSLRTRSLALIDRWSFEPLRFHLFPDRGTEIEKPRIAKRARIAGPRQVDVNRRADAARPRREHEYGVREQHRFRDAVRDEEDRAAVRRPDVLQLKRQALAGQDVERAK